VLVVFHPAGRVGVFQLAKMSEVLYLGEETVKRLLNWNATFRAMETAMESVCKKRAVQSARTFTKSSRTDSLLLTMPGYLDNGEPKISSKKKEKTENDVTVEVVSRNDSLSLV
jgi:ornithine cyclodeaminase/alanine dehydrogenase-like protein (mu-crystallin family)